MAKRTVVILHGYSDNRKSFVPLQAFLRNNGFNVADIYLGDYVTLEDQITIPDLAKAFCVALESKQIPVQAGSIDLIVHSTGALVAREWLTRYFLEDDKPCPLRRFLMLAPANFGSPLGHLGKTMVGRIVKGWKSGFQSGTQVLTALEMGSAYTWGLAKRDLFAKNSFYEPDTCMAAVFVGTKPYQEGLRKLVDKNGGDGTVYVCTANLNATGASIEFGRKKDKPVVIPWAKQKEKIAFCVFQDRDHGSITKPHQGNDDLGKMILEFLNLQPKDYSDFRDACDKKTAIALPAKPAAEIFHTYQNLVTHVIDDLGYPVKDYFLEFYERAKNKKDEVKIDALMVKIHSEILENVYPYSIDSSYRSLIFDLTDLNEELQNGIELRFSLSAAHLSDLIGYSAGSANDISELPVGSDNQSFWRPNQTFLAELVIERIQGDKAFGLFQR